MPGVGRQGQDNAGGGVIVGPSESSVLVNGSPISVIGDTVTTHGESPHVTGSSVVVSGSKTVLAGGKPITVAQISSMSCGHIITPGSGDVKAT